MLDRARFYAGAIELEWALSGVRSNDSLGVSSKCGITFD
jgi:hypothetical protein